MHSHTALALPLLLFPIALLILKTVHSTAAEALPLSLFPIALRKLDGMHSKTAQPESFNYT